MRLLHVQTLKFEQFPDDDVPSYIVASHGWSKDEATFADLKEHVEKKGDGFKKVIGFCGAVSKHRPDIKWIWIDSCCIDKRHQAELSKL